MPMPAIRAQVVNGIRMAPFCGAVEWSPTVDIERIDFSPHEQAARRAS